MVNSPNTKWNVPEPALRRLPWYLAYVKLLKKQGIKHISSTQIAEKINVSAMQIAKDLSYVDVSGKTGVGYETDSLVKVLEDFLGFKKRHKAILFGVGSLGAALLADSGLQQYGLNIIAGFDTNENMFGKKINDIPVYNARDFAKLNKTLKAEIGILAVPAEVAQEVSNEMILGGVQAIWNFTPFRIRVPKNIVLQNTSMYAHLAVMFNRMTELQNQ